MCLADCTKIFRDMYYSCEARSLHQNNNYPMSCSSKMHSFVLIFYSECLRTLVDVSDLLYVSFTYHRFLVCSFLRKVTNRNNTRSRNSSSGVTCDAV